MTVNGQAKNAGNPSVKNPLGRIIAVYQNNSDVDSETLQLKIDEAIMKEQPAINRFVGFIKIISMVAPLLGLLGTVIGDDCDLPGDHLVRYRGPENNGWGYFTGIDHDGAGLNRRDPDGAAALLRTQSCDQHHAGFK